MNRILLLLTILLLISVNATNFLIHLSCVPCTISCQFSNCYRIFSDSFDEESCSSQSCPLGLNVNLTVSPCKISSNGLTCNSGLCVNSTRLSTCHDDPSCSNSYWVNQICGACSYGTPCSSGKCWTTASSLTPGAMSQRCQQADCNGFKSINATVSPCPGRKDYLGKTCTCCVTYNAIGSSIENDYLFCINSNPVLSSNSFEAFAKKKISSSTQRYVLFSASLLLLVLLFL